MECQPFRETLGRDEKRRAGALRRQTQSCRSGPTNQIGDPRRVVRRELGFVEESGGHERVMELVGIPRVRPRLVPHAGNRRRVERTRLLDVGPLSAAARLHCTHPTLLERGVVHESVGPGVQDVVGENGRFGRVACGQPELSAMDPLQDGAQAIEVHGLLQAIADRLVHERMVGYFTIAGNVLETGRGIRKDRRHQIVGQHPLKLWRYAPAGPRARDGQRNRGVPAPARLEHGCVEKRLHEHVARRLRMEVSEDVRERERVLRSERQQQRVLCRGSLQLEIELPAKALAEREAPRFVDPAAERRMEDELHAAGLVEKALEHERLLRGDGSEHATAFGEVGQELRSSLRGQTGLGDQPLLRDVRSTDPPIGFGTEIADRARQLVAPRRRLAEPEWNGRRRAFRIGHANGAAGHLQDLPGCISQLEDVPGVALDGEVLVQRADERLPGIQEDPIVGDLGDGSARRLREQSCASPAANSSVHLIAMQKRGTPASSCRESLGGHRHDGIEIGALEGAVRPRPARQLEEIRLRVPASITGSGLGHDLLRQHVQRRVVLNDCIELAAPNRAEERRALHQVVA